MGYYGVAFEPYVGPWVGSQPVLYNAYNFDDVLRLLRPVKAAGFDRISTYGQGTFVWQGTPRIQDSNRWNIAAAASAVLKVSAGCYQQGADPGADSINVGWTQTEIDYALAQAKLHGNTDELIVGNECIWGPGSAGAVKALIEYARTKLDGQQIKLTTRQRWDVLAGVANHTPAYAPTRQAIIDLLGACDGFVYANIYPYFDPGIAAAIGQKPTEARFSTAVVQSFKGSHDALSQAFAGNGVAAEIRIGETGWPTQGWQPAQPDAQLANLVYARWCYTAIGAFLGTRIKGFAFEAYDEPWKGNQAGTNSEAHFGIWAAEGTAASPSQYTLTGEREKYSPSTRVPPGCLGILGH